MPNLSLKLFCSLFLMILLTSICSRTAYGQGTASFTKMSEVPTVDGDLSDWEDVFVKHKKENWYYGLISDDQAIYIGMAILDLDLQYQLLMTGMTCWVSYDKQEKGIHFPTGMPEKQRPDNTESLMWYIEELAETKETVIREVAGMELLNFSGTESSLWGNNLREDGLNAQLGMNSEGDILYELRIPRELFPELWTDTGSKPTRFNLTWETGSLGRPKDIAGRDVIGISGGTTSNPSVYGGETVRNIHARQDQYRAYASPRKLKLKKLSLED